MAEEREEVTKPEKVGQPDAGYSAEVSEAADQEKSGTYEDTAKVLAAVEQFRARQRQGGGAVIRPKTEEEEEKEQAQAEEKRQLLPQRVIRDLVAIYLAYVIYTLAKSLYAGEVKENHVVWVILAIVFFAAGFLWLLWPEIKGLFHKKADEK